MLHTNYPNFGTKNHNKAVTLLSCPVALSPVKLVSGSYSQMVGLFTAHLPVGLGKTPRPQLLSVSSLYGLFITEQPLGWLDFSDSCLGPAASVLRQRTGAAFGIFQPGLASFAASVSPNSLCHKACPGSRGRDTITDVDALSSQ